MLEADSARQSVQIFHQHQRTIDLVVIDLGLEDAPGTKVVEILRRLSPELKIIAVTGQALADGRDELAGTVGVLHKPVHGRPAGGAGRPCAGPQHEFKAADGPVAHLPPSATSARLR